MPPAVVLLVVFLALLSSSVASSPLQPSALPPLPPGWRDRRRLKLLQLYRVLQPANDEGGYNILPYTEMEELVRCDSCQEDAAALFEWSYEAGLVPNETKSIFEDNLCVVPFITCVRLSEALADGGPRRATSSA
ncbi:unnamed protein product [Vitrella brassicaformis CCMP3155]|uniref:Uncharacterized protein n=2 Tax=Vitrella brassicaformis TaxID=1169539 RepID=A0A0G4EVL0_VITBC|nr:unnamed protein product [Vitrella brassicaformis CCMP3155]|eukprot:CEM02120.1 unnamed protein product [Vitrella brassicaformis CCMP3155]